MKSHSKRRSNAFKRLRRAHLAFLRDPRPLGEMRRLARPAELRLFARDLNLFQHGQTVPAPDVRPERRVWAMPW